MSCIRRVSLIVNCGYARVCIYEHSNPGGRGQLARQGIDRQKRMDSFRAQFCTHPEYVIPDGYFDLNGKGMAQFDRDSSKLLDSFRKFRSDIPVNKQRYLAQFAVSQWSKLPNAEKGKHSLSNCKRCAELHSEYQSAFPLKPQYQPEPVVQLTIDHNALERQGLSKFTSNVVSELNRAFSSTASTSFVDAMVKTKSIGIEKKKSRSEKRKEKRHQQKEITSKISEQFADKAAITMLTEGESKRKYHRKRLAQSYCSPKEQPKPKKHSPNFASVSWDTEGLHDTLENWPIGTPINWTTVGRAHGIQGGNAGQVAREFAEEREINVEEIMACTPKRKRTIRPCKRKLPGSDISIPSNPPIHVIEAEIKSMISSGRFQLGEECAPYKVTKYTVVNGVMTPHDTFVHARKVPLKVIRQRLLEKHLKFMRLMPLPTVTAMTESEIKEMLQKAHYNSNLEGLSHEQLCNLLFQTQRARSLCMWHDHATILKMGFIMVTVHVMYDPLVFFTDAEYQQCHPDSSFRIQSEVEQPEVYLLSTGSSSAEDQVALVGDRISCLLI